MLDVVSPSVYVIEIAAKSQLAADFLRALEPEAGPVVFVMRTCHHTVLVGETCRREKSGPVAAARHLKIVISGLPGGKQLVHVVERRSAGWKRRAPRGAPTPAIRGGACR